MSERKGTKALELWCKRLVKDCPNVHIDNMTTSWRNGIAFCALVHHFKPDLIDLSTLNPDDIYHNNQLAFNIAEKELGIPALLDPEDMVDSDVPDRLSILTYLSQFYQRLGHKVNPKYNIETDSKDNVSPYALSTVSTNYVKTDLDKCVVCGGSVYLAQRLIVSHKLYHRRCFRCTKCSVQLSPNSYTDREGSDICCDSCKNETSRKYYNNNDMQMGMLEFSDNLRKTNIPDDNVDSINSKKTKYRPLSVLEKISLFEKSSMTDKEVDEKLGKLSVKDNVVEDKVYPKIEINKLNDNTDESGKKSTESSTTLLQNISELDFSSYQPVYKDVPDNLYKSNINKYNFLQTQLSSNDVIADTSFEINVVEKNSCDNKDYEIKDDTRINIVEDLDKKDNVNVTDDLRLIETTKGVENTTNTIVYSDSVSVPDKSINNNETKISIPPRLKKAKKEQNKRKIQAYPDNLNPFSDDEDEDDVKKPEQTKAASTNPFGSSEDEEDPVPKDPLPTKRLIATNPFWSDGEEPSSDEDLPEDRSKMYNKSALTTSTPNLPLSIPRRKKGRAPAPPPFIAVSEAPDLETNTCSTEDMASLTSMSSYNSTVHSEQKSPIKLTPRSRKKKLAPTSPGSECSHDTHEGSSTLDNDSSLSILNESMGKGTRTKGPAPGLPLPERRTIKLQMTPQELQTQLDLLETQQLGLERQGVLIEQMIRDKCEGDEACAVPQEDVEDLVIQLCELVNEKNDLFRKHTELMYIRRQQRLEQEQADIEHEIRIIHSRPVVNRIDSDKAREEQLVARLVAVVRLRDELVQQLDSERRRERQEDRAIADCIAHKRAQRNSDSNTSSMKSFEETPSPKKNKVKDKVKKQLKKAKYTLHISKKKDDKKVDKEKKHDSNDKSSEKENKTK